MGEAMERNNPGFSSMKLYRNTKNGQLRWQVSDFGSGNRFHDVQNYAGQVGELERRFQAGCGSQQAPSQTPGAAGMAMEVITFNVAGAEYNKALDPDTFGQR